MLKKKHCSLQSVQQDAGFAVVLSTFLSRVQVNSSDRTTRLRRKLARCFGQSWTAAPLRALNDIFSAPRLTSGEEVEPVDALTSSVQSSSSLLQSSSQSSDRDGFSPFTLFILTSLQFPKAPGKESSSLMDKGCSGQTAAVIDITEPLSDLYPIVFRASVLFGSCRLLSIKYIHH